MKSFSYKHFIIAALCIFQTEINAENAVITFFIKEEIQKKEEPVVVNERFMSKKLSQPSFIKAIGKDRSWLDQPGVDGLQASYLGYITISDKNGQITFPRQQQSDTIYLLVTPQMQAEFMLSPTLIHHWIVNKNSPYAFYEISRKKNKKLNTYYFDIKKIEIPKKVPLNIITIYAHPDHIQVPVGILLNTYSTNFILPELQAKKINTVKNSLYTLSIKQYFEQINIESKNDMPTITTMVTNQ
ncbi:hypothetical protein KBC04_01830 [Candidatus Babeliales bacterium]|nr:hypothetical protein [Candidatus Babeliales bacterium]MBP9843541.1 hypothetical protein [Candidatus Babeliales bacterium]